MLTISGLRVCYGSLVAVDELTLSIQAGELFVLLGGSGSGKSTLLRAIAGFVQPEAGRIVLDGADLTTLPPHQRPVNMMFQSYALFPHMSVGANIGFGLRMRGLSRAAIADRVSEMLALVRLQGFEARRPSQLSGGQQQRVALARSLAPRPALLLLDEPLSALDRNLRRDTREELVRLQHELGIAFILVTHDQEEALTMADRIGVMHQGRLVQVGTPAEVYEQPRTRFVAEFLGAANVLRITVRDGRPELSCGAVVHTGTTVPPCATWLAIRPERVMIGEADAPNRLAGVVVQRSYSGESLTHLVRLPDGTMMRATTALRQGLDAERVEVGGPVTLSWHPDACIVLQE
ncbi:MAG TPA: ABC transporter ATP-binding protein [Acetobacteraceae bacterium]|nr:ABC transporter ATP-binding protein [Acetobacteraceae bacterium]